MFCFQSFLLVVCLTCWVGAQTWSVPTGKAIAGDYTGALRPQAHFSPPRGFMNDPNGMFIDADGVYHLYYQYNPTATIAGNQHWGHATSRDLYHWENQPIAIYPSNSTEGIFSGSAVVDVNNTSGFFPNQSNGVVAIYTLANPYQQTQAIAYSTDGGYTFTPYSGNPVIEIGSQNFRDPKVIYYAPTRMWVMAVSYAQEFTIGIFTSPNLKTWTHVSNFSNHGLLGNQFECPNLIEIPVENSVETMYLMLISINPGAPLGGSISQYIPGQFNGTHFTPVDAVARLADFGKDNYAGQFFYGIPSTQPQVSIAWASNWEYCNSVPTGPLEGWQSIMSLPRINYLANISRTGWDLISKPYLNLAPLLPSTPLAANASLGNGTLLVDFSSLESKAILLELNITALTPATLSNTASANFTFVSSMSGEYVAGGQFLAGDAPFFLTRGGVRGFENPFFTDKVSSGNAMAAGVAGALAATAGTAISVVLDRSVIEAFAFGGQKSATLTFYPEWTLDTLVVSVAGLNPAAVASVRVWGLRSGWSPALDHDAGPAGNQSMLARAARLAGLY